MTFTNCNFNSISGYFHSFIHNGIITFIIILDGLNGANRSAVSNPTPTDAQTDPTNEPTADPITNSIPAPTDIPSIQSTHALFGMLFRGIFCPYCK